MIQFHETMMGRRFYEGTMPDLVNEVEELRKTLDKGIKVQGLEELTAALNRCADALENSYKAEHAQKEEGTDEDPVMSHTACTDEQTCHPDGTEEVVSKPEPFHITATPDERGYTITIPEYPEISAHCEDAADIIPTATKAKAEDRQRRVCPKCGKEYTDAPALSRKDNTDICPECGTREALEDAGFSQDEQHEIIETIYHKHDSLPDPDSFTPEERKTYKKRLSAVKKNWEMIKKVEEKYQTEELCLEAVKQNSSALQYVQNQTPEICLEAIKHNSYSLQYVKNQTQELCLAAVKQSGSALRYVRAQTPDICMAAVENAGWTLKYVNEQTPEIRLAAVKQNGWALQFIPKQDQTLPIVIAALKQDPESRRYLATKFRKPEVYKEAGLDQSMTHD